MCFGRATVAATGLHGAQRFVLEWAACPQGSQPVCSDGQAYGARPLRRAVVALVEDPLADALLAGRLPQGSTAWVDLDAAGAVAVLLQPRDVAPPVVNGIVASTGLGIKRRESVNVSA